MRAYLMVGTSCLAIALWTYGCSGDETTSTTTSSPASGPTSSTVTGPGSGGSIASVGAGGDGGAPAGGAGGEAVGGSGGMMSAGGMGGTTMVGGMGGTLSVGGAGGAGATGGGGGMSGVGGGGGSISCLSCSQYIQQCLNMSACPSESLLCAQSLTIYQPLETCTCATCSGQCTQTCSNMGTDSMGCFGCLAQAAQANCPGQLQACLAD